MIENSFTQSKGPLNNKKTTELLNEVRLCNQMINDSSTHFVMKQVFIDRLNRIKKEFPDVFTKTS